MEVKHNYRLLETCKNSGSAWMDIRYSCGTTKNRWCCTGTIKKDLQCVKNEQQPPGRLDIQETEFGGPAESKQKRIIYFSSGETLEEEDSEEGEELSSDRPPFSQAAEKTRFSFKNVALLVGRISLLTCDFLGERLAGALGLNAAKYQYAIDQYHRDHKTPSSQATDALSEVQSETIHLSPGLDGSHYGATGDVRCPVDSQKSCDENHMDRQEGCHNRGYLADEDYLE